MATIDNASIIKELLINDGIYSNDPIPHSIWSYDNDFGGKTYSVCYKMEAMFNLMDSPYCHCPVLLWQDTTKLTAEGHEWLAAHAEL